jgi:hypothetical protein
MYIAKPPLQNILAKDCCIDDRNLKFTEYYRKVIKFGINTKHK